MLEGLIPKGNSTIALNDRIRPECGLEVRNFAFTFYILASSGRGCRIKNYVVIASYEVPPCEFRLASM